MQKLLCHFFQSETILFKKLKKFNLAFAQIVVILDILIAAIF